MKWIFLLLVLILTGCELEDQITAEVVVEIPEESGEDIEVYFCPHDDCEEKLYDFIDSANESVHCALFELALESLKDLLKEKSKEVDVKLVVDGDYYDKVENLSFARKDTTSQLTHNKFCIVDAKKVFTGSFNPTERGTKTNNNNMLLIDSKILAENYEDEFNELWSGVFGDGGGVENPILIYNGINIQNYFCPEDSCMEKVVDELRKANESIYFMTFSFTHKRIANMLILRMYDGVDVKGVYEKRNWKTSTFSLLEFQGADVKLDNNSYSMHHKVFIIDNRTVITGSFNPTKAGDYRNDENLIIIEDKDIASLYLEEFKHVYG